MSLVYNPTLVRSEYQQRATRNALTLLRNGAGVIRVESADLEGDEIRVARFKIPANLITKRTTSGTGAEGDATVIRLSESDEKSARLSRKIGPVGIRYAMDMGRTNRSENAFSMQVAEMLAEQMAINQIDAAVSSAVGALTGTTGAWVDRTVTAVTTKTATTQALLAGLKLMGDVANRIKAWVMPSAAFFDLVGDQIANAPELVGSGAIYTGIPGTFNRPVLVTDAPALSPSDHWIIGLTEDALHIRDDNGPLNTLDMAKDLKAENAQMILRADPDYSVSVLGYAYDMNPLNPDDSDLAATANWAAALPVKSGAGIAIKVAAS
jgi:hypothetical protein